MVTIKKIDNNFIFEVKGMHKLWALKSQLSIPQTHIITAKLYDGQQWNLGLRFPGTYLPGVITAGTFYGKDGTIFCDVSNKENAILVELKDEKYNKLIIEVENPIEAIELLAK